ncbi:MAG TPA: VirB8/TrbF family protein [Candidatus Binataceae bacterium]|nr:VirB8/TrbF family protein [Candidatus Binataceae bacterium]
MNSNPYVEAHREWDERYADLVLGKRNWQIAAGALLLLSLILAAGVVWQSTRSRFIPYVVEVDKLGYGLTVPKPLIPSSDPALVDRMERYEVASFIRNSRSVSSDPSAEQHMLNDMLAHAKGSADKYLDEYFHSDNFAHNPFKKAEQQTISVQIDSILELSAHSFQVRWTEQARDRTGATVDAATHWEAALQTQISPPGSDDAIVSNPLGFYVTQISWAEQQS